MGTGLGFPHLSFAEEPQAQYSLVIEPEQCVAMRQGQVCYVDVKMNWRAKKVDNYCLFSSLQTKALQCWDSALTGAFQLEMSANENIIFNLKVQGDVNSLITKELKMAWVYDKRTRKNVSWRMF